MKKISVFILITAVMLFFSACTNSKTPTVSNNMNYIVASELEKIDGIDSLEDETIKALSVVVRTNLKSGAATTNALNKNEAGEEVNEKLLSLANQTSNEVLLEDNSLANVSYGKDKNQTWTVQIKKSDILSFFNKHNISLANISKVVPVFDDNKNLVYLDVCGKQISYETLKNEFGLKSSKITNIENSVSSIKITGEGAGETFDIREANKLSLDGKSYREILKVSFKAYTIG